MKNKHIINIISAKLTMMGFRDVNANLKIITLSDTKIIYATFHVKANYFYITNTLNKSKKIPIGKNTIPEIIKYIDEYSTYDI